MSTPRMLIDIVETQNMSPSDEGANSTIIGYFVT
jgi:hypothetical protein